MDSKKYLIQKGGGCCSVFLLKENKEFLKKYPKWRRPSLKLP
jgi:hypothetical protein